MNMMIDYVNYVFSFVDMLTIVVFLINLNGYYVAYDLLIRDFNSMKKLFSIQQGYNVKKKFFTKLMLRGSIFS